MLLIVLKEFVFKLMINSVYGKNVRLINNSKDYVKCVSKPHLFHKKIFSKNLASIHKIKSVLVLNKTNLCRIQYS